MNIPNPATALWKKSSRSNGQANCVEVCTSQPGVVAVRDSKNVPGPEIAVSDQAWSQFIRAIRRGELDL
jgi:Domain of unknown function (DUF397)